MYGTQIRAMRFVVNVEMPSTMAAHKPQSTKFKARRKATYNSGMV